MQTVYAVTVTEDNTTRYVSTWNRENPLKGDASPIVDHPADVDVVAM